MIKHLWTVLCKKTIIDKDSNNLNIIEILEQLTIDVTRNNGENQQINAINIPVEYEIVSMWYRSGKQSIKADLEIDLFDPNNKLTKTFLQPIEIPENMKRFRSIFKISGISISEQGDYLYKIKIKDKKENNFKTVAEIPLQIEVNESVNK